MSKQRDLICHRACNPTTCHGAATSRKISKISKRYRYKRWDYLGNGAH